jgi:hypothetical protein
MSTVERLVQEILSLPDEDRQRLIEMVSRHQEPKPKRTPEQIKEYISSWSQVYDGLSEEDIDDIEAIALDRSHWRTTEAQL